MRQSVKDAVTTQAQEKTAQRRAESCKEAIPVRTGSFTQGQKPNSDFGRGDNGQLDDVGANECGAVLLCLETVAKNSAVILAQVLFVGNLR